MIEDGPAESAPSHTIMSIAEHGARPVVLVAEDSENDRGTLRYAALVAQPQFEFRFVHDGAQAVEYLKREGRYATAELFPLPKLLVMDFHMPKLNGLEVLSWLETSPEFKDLKIIMLTGSMNPQLLAILKQKHALCFQKPVDLNSWVEFVRGLQMLLAKV